ncbi:hypothetical protein [Mesorhizobium sp. NPDC059025]|uniref:hypothetical protein n=1 Tax=unclassified Mesorhizobium TaxID=325217 RepID=UPI0036B6D5F9
MSDVIYRVVFRYQILIATLFVLPASSYYLQIALPESFLRSKISAALFPRAACDAAFLANSPSIPFALYQSALLLVIMASIAFAVITILLALLRPTAAVILGLKPGPHTKIHGRIAVFLLLAVVGYFFLTTFGASSPDRNNCSWFKWAGSLRPSAIYEKLFLAGMLAAASYTGAYSAILMFLSSRMWTPSLTPEP